MASKIGKPDPYVLKQWLLDRNRGRTDPFFLANTILGYPDINPTIHGNYFDNLQKFKGCDDYVDRETGRLIQSTARLPLWNLSGNTRRSLNLMPRGSMKTTCMMTHTLQWILNYPDVRILWNMSADTRSKEIATELLSHFRYNEKFRFYYPEYCPPTEAAANWGSMEYFNVPNRKVYRRAPTLSFASVGKIIAGPHYEVVIHSDIVDKNNINTPNGIQEVIQHFRWCIPLIEASNVAPYTGWCLLEGTIYSFSDLYSYIIEMKNSGQKNWQPWQVLTVDAEKDSKSKISYWPERFPWERLMEIKDEVGPVAYAANYRQHPIAEGEGLTDRVDVKPFQKVIKPLLPQMRLHATVDLHGMEDNLGNDYTVINVSGFLRSGHVVCLDIRRGHFTPFEVINTIFEVDKVWGGKIVDWKIEKDAHFRVLAAFLEREMVVRGRWLSIVPIKRDNKLTKHHRIKGLQAWFAGKVLSFSDSITCLDDVILEIKQFPKGRHDDILDTLADHMQNRDGGVIGDSKPLPKPDITNPFVGMMGRFKGFDPLSHEPVWSDSQMESVLPHDWQPWMKGGV